MESGMDAGRCVLAPAGVTQRGADRRLHGWLGSSATWRHLWTKIRRLANLGALDQQNRIVQPSGGVWANPASALEFAGVEVEATACGGVCVSCTSPGAIELYCGCIEHPNGIRCACRQEHQLHDTDVGDRTSAARSPARSSVRVDEHKTLGRQCDGKASLDDANWRERVWTQR